CPWFVSVQADGIIPEIGTQGVEGISLTSYVPGFDPSQTNKGDEWWTPRTSVRDSIAPLPSHWEKWNKGKGLQLTDSPLRTDGSPQSSLYYCFEESWIGFTEWVKKAKPLPLGLSMLNFSIATRIVSPGQWLGNEEMNAVMFIWRVNTTLKRWAPSRVAFLNAMFCLQIDDAYNKFFPNKKTENNSGENLEIDSIMSSANSSSTPTDRVAKQRGIPTRCNCGEAVSRFTSNRVKNPGRLFHRCPMGSEKDKSHLFKWTDKSVVEEIEDFQDLFDVLLVDNIEF
ncbi:hypothetical protein HID58_067451, partial [Brassica napus]